MKTIQGYLKKTQYLPKLNRYVKYSDEFKEQYNKWVNCITARYDDDFKVCFIAGKAEIEQFYKELKAGKLKYNGQILTDPDPYLIQYSKGFKDGFNELKLQKGENELVKILEARHSKPFPLFRSGILTIKRHYKNGVTELLPPEPLYFEGKREGRMYKARFLFMENYMLFREFTGVEQFEKTEQLTPLEIDYASHKILILYELGILDYLKENYSVLAIDTNTNLSKLLAPLLGEKPGTIRKVLTNLDNPRSTRPVINSASVRKVTAELKILGIEVKKLPDL